MIRIYVPDISPRLNYVLKQVFSEFLQVNYTVVAEKPAVSPNEFVIYYTDAPGHCDLRILPAGILHENHISDQKPTVHVSAQSVKLFPNNSDHFGFDIFAAVFWMLSRYEEYQDFTPDKHGRFPASASLAFQQEFILQPVVDQWMLELKKRINRKKSGMVPERTFLQINTIDVDNAYAYRGKGFGRQTGALLKHAFKGQLAELRERLKVLRGKKEDPFDTYAYIKQVAEAAHVKTIFFHLAGELDVHDRNIDVKNPVYQKLLQSLAEWSQQQLHPSYQSNAQPALLQSEKQKLESVTQKTVVYSRQHFLKLRFPETYRQLLACGIQRDFTMGFADHIGFRAGTGRAFAFFDLAANAETSLIVQPLCIMEGTLKFYMQVSPEKAMEYIAQMRAQLQQLQSTYVAVWHNETLCERGPWKGWRKVYESQFAR